MHPHLTKVWHTLSDISVLALYNVTGFALALLTEPWLHWTRYIGSDALNKMARSGQVWWGLFGLVIVALAFLYRPRWFGLVAVIALVSVRGYDFWTDEPRNWLFLGSQVVFVAMAIRGTNRRAVYYG